MFQTFRQFPVSQAGEFILLAYSGRSRRLESCLTGYLSRSRPLDGGKRRSSFFGLKYFQDWTRPFSMAQIASAGLSLKHLVNAFSFKGEYPRHEASEGCRTRRARVADCYCPWHAPQDSNPHTVAAGGLLLLISKTTQRRTFKI